MIFDLEGIVYNFSNNTKICLVNFLSDSFKDEIRNRLSSICYGMENPLLEKKYSYKVTLENFFKRYDKKEPFAKVGLMGELLSHVLINKYSDNLIIGSIFFNKEEKTNKKGFDIMFYDSETYIPWYCEVKSGSYTGRDINSKYINLVKNADSDLIEKFDSGDSRLWDNASYDIALTTPNDLKGKLSDVISQHYPDDGNKIKKNIILTGVVFSENKSDDILVELEKLNISITGRKDYENVTIFGIQEKTYLELESFLRSEIGM